MKDYESDYQNLPNGGKILVGDVANGAAIGV